MPAHKLAKIGRADFLRTHPFDRLTLDKNAHTFPPCLPDEDSFLIRTQHHETVFFCMQVDETGRPAVKPSELKRVVARLQALGFEVSLRPGPVDRASRPMTVELKVKSRNFSIEERETFAKFFETKTK